MRVVMAAWARGLLPIKAQLLPHLNGAQRPSGLLGAVNPHSNPYNYTCKSFKGSRKGAKARDRALITAQSDHSSGRDAEKSAIHADLGTPSQGENGAEVPLQQQHSPGLAEGTPATPPQGKVTARSLLTLATTKVLTNLWPLLLVHFTCDVFVFLLHRLSHRVTNELAVNLLGGGFISPAVIGNMWWLTADPAIANFQTGYQTLTIAVFLLAFPLNVLLKTLASAATILICNADAGADVKAPWWQPWLGLGRALPVVRSIWPTITSLWASVFVVELLVSAAVIPLQFASLAVITLPITLPIIVSLLTAAPVAVLERRRGWDAIQQSRKLVWPIKWALAVPFLGLVVTQRLVESGKTAAMGLVPPRFYRELIEVPVGLMLAGVALTVFLTRLQDVLPFCAYTEATRWQRELGEGGKGGDGQATAAIVS